MSFAPSDLNPVAAKQARVAGSEAADALARARKAWAEKLTAESQLSRLAGFRSLSPGMKDDRNRWLRRLSEADATLRSVLGGGR